MKDKALILAAHGSHHQPMVNRWISQLAQEVGSKLGIDEAMATFHQGVPIFAKMLDAIQSKTAIVVPFMSSEGFYCNRVLPEQLAKNVRFNQVDVSITPPIGVHEKLPNLVCSRIGQLMLDHQLEPNQTTIAIVGHGSARAPQSRLATEHLAELVRRDVNIGHVVEAFLDEQPSVESIVDRSPGDAIVVIPFLIGVGPHVLQDIPSRLGLKTWARRSTDRLDLQRSTARAKACGSAAEENFNLSANTGYPMAVQQDDKLIVFDVPVGSYPAMSDLIVDLVQSDYSVTTS